MTWLYRIPKDYLTPAEPKLRAGANAYLQGVGEVMIHRLGVTNAIIIYTERLKSPPIIPGAVLLQAYTK